MFVHDWRWERRQEMVLGWPGLAWLLVEPLLHEALSFCHVCFPTFLYRFHFFYPCVH